MTAAAAVQPGSSALSPISTPPTKTIVLPGTTVPTTASASSSAAANTAPRASAGCPEK